MAETPHIRFLVFDVESVADGQLVSKIRFPGEDLTPADAIRKYRDELIEQKGTDFIPYSFQIPISVVAAKVSGDYSLVDIVALDQPKYRPHKITQDFWRGWEAYHQPTLVTFNGRSFDIPLLELAAFRYGINVGSWLATNGPNYQQPRYRYNTSAHFDLYEILTNFGSSRLTGGLNLSASMLGKPGKMDTQGYMVQDMYDQGQLAEINDYCRCDVLDTYFVFLRLVVVMGNLTLDQEQALVATAKTWIEQRAEDSAAYRLYLERWGDWKNPWTSADPVSDS
ncbi:MAG TPA: 3'-5' exonuclease [Pirellulaceae bacterium]|nr:3'-5' exonuclease [Pirellulaceae bacterium]